MQFINIIIKKLCGKCAVEADSEIVVKAEETADGYILYTAEFLTEIWKGGGLKGSPHLKVVNDAD